MTILRVVYASAPTSEVIIPTLEIQIPGMEPLRICGDHVDHFLGVGGEYHRFEATALSITLPAKNTTGQQNLAFGVVGVTGRAQKYVDQALDAGERIPMIYRAYLASDKSAPANRPLTMYLAGGQFEGDESQFEGSYYDLLNTAWPRERYTIDTAPGLKYL